MRIRNPAFRCSFQRFCLFQGPWLCTQRVQYSSLKWWLVQSSQSGIFPLKYSLRLLLSLVINKLRLLSSWELESHGNILLFSNDPDNSSWIVNCRGVGVKNKFLWFESKTTRRDKNFLGKKFALKLRIDMPLNQSVPSRLFLVPIYFFSSSN